MSDIKTVGAFTPGPWEVKKDGDQWRVRQKGSTRRISGGTIERPICEEFNCKADASLAASSPELLEALEGMISLFPDGVEDSGSGVGFTEYLKAKYRAANKAVAKARGEA